MENESIFKHLEGAKPVNPKIIAKLEEGMRKNAKTSREKEIQRCKNAQIARGWLIK